ncbi:hypothetical protein FQV27_17805 [Paracoccus aurantiacus]|uniref:Uncharacterized protein n=1 Tax=Paracoccus aurantiacus TaxID=2599412 RepID=A0A5C6RQG2_9RHOB|nr:hypothetical protein [Paracoccus aurantiacus]TXB64407.1 hypothetical protein FQV27_17805 [Paracoccus aurantiacus]
MTQQKTRLIGATAIAAIAIAGALVAWQAASQGAGDPAQLSDEEKLEILNSGDADAIAELLEAEEAAAQAQFARERLERQKREAEIEVERAEAEARGAAYWDSFDVDEIDLTGFEVAITTFTQPEERQEKLAELPIVAGFDRATEVAHLPSKFECNPRRFGKIGDILKSQPDLSATIDRYDIANLLDYLASRAALETGDCSCATQAVPLSKGEEFARRLFENSVAETTGNSVAGGRIIKRMSAALFYALDAEKRSFCGKG